MQPLAHLISLTLAVGCATAFAADRAADPAKTSPSASAEVQSRQAAVDAAAREKADPVPAEADAKTTRAANRKLLAAVRRAVVHDKTLSMAGHNVRLEAKAGVVTISGDVRNAAEISKIEAIARKVAGVTNVDNQMTLKTATMARTPKSGPVATEKSR